MSFDSRHGKMGASFHPSHVRTLVIPINRVSGACIFSTLVNPRGCHDKVLFVYSLLLPGHSYSTLLSYEI